MAFKSFFGLAIVYGYISINQSPPAPLHSCPCSTRTTITLGIKCYISILYAFRRNRSIQFSMLRIDIAIYLIMRDENTFIPDVHSRPRPASMYRRVILSSSPIYRMIPI